MPNAKRSQVPHEAIKIEADYQINWASKIKPLRRDKYLTEGTDSLSIHGDAPKCFLRIQEYIRGRPGRDPQKWVSYIAKVGSKW